MVYGVENKKDLNVSAVEFFKLECTSNFND